MSAALATPCSLPDKGANTVSSEVTEAQARKKEGPLAAPVIPTLLAGTGQRGTHWLRLPQSWQEVYGAGPKRMRADGAAPRWPSSCRALVEGG